ncbi:MAG: nascent polypeptide-associated complex protein [archaeon]
MFPGMNQAMMKQAMKKMGIKQEELDANEVIIKLKDKNLVIKNPSVTKINMQGQESFQITGDVEEKESVNEEDIKTVIEQTRCNRKEAIDALKKYDDIAEAIISLSFAHK